MRARARHIAAIIGLLMTSACSIVSFEYIPDPTATARSETYVFRTRSNAPTITVLPILAEPDTAYVDEVATAMIAFAARGDLIAVEGVPDGRDFRKQITGVTNAYGHEHNPFHYDLTDGDAEIVRRERWWLSARDDAFLSAALKLVLDTVPQSFSSARMGAAWPRVTDASAIPIVGVSDPLLLLRLLSRGSPSTTNRRRDEFEGCDAILTYFEETQRGCHASFVPSHRADPVGRSFNRTLSRTTNPSLCRILSLHSLHPLEPVLRLCARGDDLPDVPDDQKFDLDAFGRAYGRDVIRYTLHALAARSGRRALLVIHGTVWLHEIERAILDADVGYEAICVPHGCKRTLRLLPHSSP